MRASTGMTHDRPLTNRGIARVKTSWGNDGLGMEAVAGTMGRTKGRQTSARTVPPTPHGSLNEPIPVQPDVGR
jgi:hypothetical protein